MIYPRSSVLVRVQKACWINVLSEKSDYIHRFTPASENPPNLLKAGFLYQAAIHLQLRADWRRFADSFFLHPPFPSFRIFRVHLFIRVIHEPHLSKRYQNSYTSFAPL
jgi:hypothetical protein